MCQSLAQWLDGLGVGQYLQIFLDNDVDLTSVRLLHEADLHEMNISLGHRKLLLRAIAALAGDEPPAPAPPPTPPQADTPDAGAERRQLTVMFCDLVGSSALSRRLDPEDLQRVLLGWHECVRSAVAPYEGTVARFLGDGVLVYFGFPRAHEDDATRAVRGALAVLAALRAQRPTGLDAVGALEARIGIATGQVVTREIGI